MRDSGSGQRHRRVLAYCRVSSVEQGRGVSLAAQQEEITRHATETGLPEPLVFVEIESGGQGKEEKRIEQIRLMASVQAGDLVVVAKQDRWSRDTLHFLESTKKILAKGASFLSLAERFDPSTPEGEFAATIMAAVARQEHQRIRARLVGTRQWLRTRGAYVEGTAPLGYRIEKRKLLVNEAEAQLVRRVFALCIEGRSTRETAEIVRAENPASHRGLDASAIARYLRDRRYLGEMNTSSVRVEGRGRQRPVGEWIQAHQPIVDEATWRAAQVALTRRAVGGRPSSGEARNAVFMLRGMITCGACGRTCSAHAPEPGASIRHGGYYQCPSKCVRARYADVDAFVEEKVLERIDALTSRLSKPARARKPEPDRSAERARLIRRRSNVVEAIASGVLTAELAKSKLAEIESQIGAIDAARVVTHEPVDRGVVLADLRARRAAWREANLDARREIIGLIADEIELHSTATARWQRGAWKIELAWRETD